MPNLASKAILACLIPFGALALHGFAKSNGLIQMFEDLGEQTLLSDGVTEWTGSFTGLAGPDRLLRTLVNFFWVVVNRHDFSMSLHSFMFAGQGVPLLVLNMLEGARAGNKSLLVSYVTIFGILYMVVGLAIMAPFYLFLHLLTSRTAKAPSEETLSVDAAKSKAIVVGVFFGYVVPTVFMTLPNPSVLPTDVKIRAVAFWQAVPLWSAVCAFTASKIIGPSRASKSATGLPYGLSLTYSLSVGVATVTHIATLIIAARSSGTWLETLDFMIPPNPFDTSVRISDFLQGATWFLQWDYVVMSLAYLVWAVTIRHRAERSGPVKSLGSIVLELLTMSLVAGPLGAACYMVWDRDDVVWQTQPASPEKGSKGRPRRMSRKWMFG